MRRVVCVLGSPRPAGNAAALAKAFCAAAAAAGAQVERFALNGLNFRGCQGCLACKKRGARGCVLTDGLTPVLAAIAACDVLVLASPVYFGDVSSQTKACIDRTFSFLVPEYRTLPPDRRSRLAPGKTLVMLLAQGNPDETAFADICPRYAALLAWQGFTRSRVVRGCGLRTEDAAAGRPELLARAAALGRELASETATSPGS